MNFSHRDWIQDKDEHFHPFVDVHVTMKYVNKLNVCF